MLPGRTFVIVICFESADRRRFLMVRNIRRGWELPGGRVESGEGVLEAAAREFLEETGHRLESARLLLTQERASGRCHVVTGAWGRAMAAEGPHRESAIVETRFVERLRDVDPLAFPDDPYPEIEDLLGRTLR